MTCLCQDLEWNGMREGSVFHKPKANVLLTVEGFTNAAMKLDVPSIARYTTVGVQALHIVILVLFVKRISCDSEIALNYCNAIVFLNSVVNISHTCICLVNLTNLAYKSAFEETLKSVCYTLILSVG